MRMSVEVQQEAHARRTSEEAWMSTQGTCVWGWGRYEQRGWGTVGVVRLRHVKVCAGREWIVCAGGGGEGRGGGEKSTQRWRYT